MENMDAGGMHFAPEAGPGQPVPPGWRPYGRPPTGSFIGHVVPGSFFILWSIWWMISLARVHYYNQPKASRQKKESKSTPALVSFGGRPLAFFPMMNLRKYQRQLLETPVSQNAGDLSPTWGGILWDSSSPREVLPWAALAEPIIIVTMTLIGIAIEMTAARWTIFRDGMLQSVNNMQHTTMYMGFTMGSLVAIFASRTPMGRALWPERTEHVLYVFAFLQEGILFALHTPHGTPQNAILEHVLLSWTIFACAGSGVYLTAAPNSLIGASLLAYSVMLQGFWFWVVAIFEYTGEVPVNPRMMVVVVTYIWCMITASLIFLITFAVVGSRTRRAARRAARNGVRLRAGAEGRAPDGEYGGQWPSDLEDEDTMQLVGATAHSGKGGIEIVERS